MARGKVLKFFLALVAIVLGVWNYFLRDSLSLPFLSTLSSIVVWVIVGVVVVLWIAVMRSRRYRW